MSTASSESFFPKDRKRSAHWSDSDTDILVDVLLRERDTGRTVDNGFKPEVWKEAARLLENSNFVGGPKTPEACRSRWQRVGPSFIMLVLQLTYYSCKGIIVWPRRWRFYLDFHGITTPIDCPLLQRHG